MKNRKALIYFAIFFIIYEFNTYIANDMIMPGMVKVVAEFNASVENIAKSLSLYIIGGSTLQIFLGPLCDRYGKRNVLLFGNALFLLTSALIPFVQNIDQFLVARYFQGMGLCFIFIGYALIHELFDDKTAVKLCALFSNISIFAPLIGPVIGSGIIVISSWRYIFIVTTCLAIVSFFGILKNMPNNKPLNNKINLVEISKTYLKIINTRILVQGGLIIAITFLPMINWVGLAPILVIKIMGKSFSDYVVYQSIVFGGFILSSIAMQFIAGRFSFYTLITRGSLIMSFGLFLSCIFHSNLVLFIFGMFVASLGIGLFSGSIFRISITSTGISSSMSAATLNIIQATLLALGLEVVNHICGQFNYSILSFSIINLAIGVLMLVLAFNFALLFKSKKWQ